MPRESLITLHLLNAMVDEILRAEVPVADPSRPMRRKTLHQSQAEIIDERLFRRTLLGMPMREAPQLLRRIQPKFYSRRFRENCFLALRKLAAFNRAA